MLANDPDMRYTPNGNAVTSFSVAVNRTWGSGDEKEEATGLVPDKTAGTKLAEVCNQYVTKGMMVYVEGRPSVSAWMGREGEARANMEITAFEVQFPEQSVRR